MFRKKFLKKGIISTLIIFSFQFPIFAQAINGEIKVKAENLPVVLVEEEISASIAEREISKISSGSAQLYFTTNLDNEFVKENDFLQTVLEGINKERLASSLPILALNSQLNRAAELKAADMIENDYFAHNSPNGLTPWHWFSEVGYNFSYAGENLAVDFDLPQDMVKAWMDSPKHRQNILDNHFDETGLAIIEGNYKGHSALFVVQTFGQLQARVNDFVNADLIVSSGEESINLIQAVINYQPDQLMFDSVDFSNSDFSLFWEEVDVEKGTISIVAIQPFPGIKGISKIANIKFKTLVKSDANLSLSNDSVVLANDGFGTNILDDVIDSYYSIK